MPKRAKGGLEQAIKRRRIKPTPFLLDCLIFEWWEKEEAKGNHYKWLQSRMRSLNSRRVRECYAFMGLIFGEAKGEKLP